MNDVTLILTTRDRPTMFGVARDSALASGADLIVVDDGSDPEYAGADMRFERSIGFIRARLAALARIRTPYVAFLDDDDALGLSWLPLSLAKMAEGYDVVAASYWETDAALRPVVARVLLPGTLPRLLSGHCPVNDGALMRRTILDDVTWHPERDTVAMYSLWLELAARGARFGVVEEPCWYHRIHGGNMSAALPEQDAAWRAEAIAEWAVPA